MASPIGAHFHFLFHIISFYCFCVSYSHRAVVQLRYSITTTTIHTHSHIHTAYGLIVIVLAIVLSRVTWVTWARHIGCNKNVSSRWRCFLPSFISLHSYSIATDAFVAEVGFRLCHRCFLFPHISTHSLVHFTDIVVACHAFAVSVFVFPSRLISSTFEQQKRSIRTRTHSSIWMSKMCEGGKGESSSKN